MAVIEELIRAEENGSISFGNYELAEKKKVSDFEHDGDLYKVKTYCEITRLEKNDAFAFESVPGTAVHDFEESEEGLSFTVEGVSDAEVTVGLEENTTYEVGRNGEYIGEMSTNRSGKLTFSLNLEKEESATVVIQKK